MRKSVRAAAIVGLGLCPAVGLALLHDALGVPLMVYNPSSSEPVGLYRLAAASPAPGRLIVFHVPAPGRAYAPTHLRYVARNAILKGIAAGPGSTVCEREATVYIDGQRRGTVAPRDHNGALLPHWSGCHRLQPGEYFAFSNRIPNSFDSRYYGPVHAQDMLGVYAPIWTQ